MKPIFRWRGFDGSELLAIRQLGNYDNAVDLRGGTVKAFGLPCGGTIVSVRPSGKTDVVVVFRLIERPGHQCDGPGSEASALFRIRDGRIVLWHQAVPPVQPTGGTV